MQRQRHIADLVEEQRAAVSGVEQAGLVTVGAGKGALAIAEQFALQQVLRQRRTVLHDERLAAPRAAIVDGAGNQFLAGTGLASEQHTDRAVQHLADQLVDTAHGLALTEQTVAAGTGRAWNRRDVCSTGGTVDSRCT